MRWLIAAVVLVGAALAAAGLWRHERPTGPAALGPGAYRLHYGFTLNLATPEGGTQKVSATVDGTLDLVRRGDSELLARAKVGTLALDDGAKKLGFLAHGAEEALASPFSLSTGADGHVTEIRLAPELPLPVRSILATVAGGTQYVRAAQPGAKSWRTSEEDLNGAFHPTYRLVARDDVEKTWNLGDGDPLGGLEGKATAHFALDGARVRSVTLDEEGDTLSGRSAGPRSPFSLVVSLERTGDADTSWVSAVHEDGLAAFTTESSVPKKLRVAGPAPRPRAELLQAVAKATEKDPLVERENLRDELTESVAQDPKTGEALEALLLSADVSRAEARLAIEALLGARTPDSDRRAGRLLVSPKVTADVRTMLLGGATVLDRPGPEVVGAVRTLLKTAPLPVAGQAAMALGGLVGALEPTDPKTSDTAAEELLGMAKHVLEPAPNDPRVPFGVKVSFLRALGNLGTPDCLPLVRVGLADDDELVRAAAAKALRFQDPATVKVDLDKGMQDPSMEVRAAVLKAARKMGPAATEDLVKTALYFDKSEFVRLEAVYTFGAWSNAAPAMLQVLTDAAAHEKSEKVLQAIRNMTNKNQVEPPFMKQPLTQATP